MNKIYYVIDGVSYTAMYGLGSQLTSLEYRRVKAGTYRKITPIVCGKTFDFVVFQTGKRTLRNCFRVPTYWGFCGSESLDECHKKIGELRAELQKMY